MNMIVLVVLVAALAAGVYFFRDKIPFLAKKKSDAPAAPKAPAAPAAPEAKGQGHGDGQGGGKK